MENGNNDDDDDDDDDDDVDDNDDDDDDDETSSVTVQMRHVKTTLECSNSRCISMAKGSAKGFTQHG